ncbi:Transcription factor IIA, alpha/beta subunit [Cynara cardunculus var. scolymus]|uniref:Transcription factor IIA, alpha/beta subunit n=1 Tax=Cynara cardunculus var. scolymus TaxID=59895 RepID=A0A124SI90_CYNCS|nr:Transcription factor IIA, alpha/beta subunit [Cynara cardunculus var. scolymus]
MQTYLYSPLYTLFLFRTQSNPSRLQALKPSPISTLKSNIVPTPCGIGEMASSTTSTVYVQVIEDVISKIREEFINSGGPGEGVLNELQGLWELKMMQAGAIFGPIDRSASKLAAPGAPTNPVHDLNVPYEGPEEYETPTADLLFPPVSCLWQVDTFVEQLFELLFMPSSFVSLSSIVCVPTPLQTPMQTPLPAQTPLPGTAPTPLPGTVDSSYNIPTGGTPITPNDYPPVNEDGASESRAGRPSPYMKSRKGTLYIQIPSSMQNPVIDFINNICDFFVQQPPSPWLNQRPPLDVNVAYVEGREEVERGVAGQPTTQDFFQASTGKRKRDDFSSQYRPGGYIPQQDGAGDVFADKSEVGQGSRSQLGIVIAGNKKLGHGLKLSQIPQLDGPIPDPYDDAVSTPNIYNYQGVVNEDYNVANTPAPPELQAPTPAMVNQNDVIDDDEEEPLNENDDDDDLDDVDQGEELSTHHLVLAQFDKVTRAKSRWKCTLKDGIMHINNKDVLFNKATGEFDF